MNVPMLHGGELLSASEAGPVFRSLFLPSKDPSASVEFYLKFGFQKTVTQVEGVPREFPTVTNDWHTLIFYEIADNSPFWTEDPPPSGVIPRFVCTGAEKSFSSFYSPHPDFEGMEVTDPDGRSILLLKSIASPRQRNTGLLCWIDALEAFRHTFIRVDMSNEQSQATIISFTKQSGFLHWPPGRFLPVDERSTLVLDPGDVSELVGYLRSTPPNRLGTFDSDDDLANNTFYRFLLVDDTSSGLEITVPLSQIESCFARLSKPVRVLLGWH